MDIDLGLLRTVEREREIPSEEMPSIGTGCASTKVAARRRANTPPSTAASGSDAANRQMAYASSAKPESATGTTTGRSRAVSRETKRRSGFTRPDALSAKRMGPRLTAMG